MIKERAIDVKISLKAFKGYDNLFVVSKEELDNAITDMQQQLSSQIQKEQEFKIKDEVNELLKEVKISLFFIGVLLGIIITKIIL